jgi:hypothetical protein
MVICKINCEGCGAKEEKVFVRDRGKNEDILEWIKEVQYQASIVHSIISRECGSAVFELMIPIDPVNNRVGMSE